MMIIRLTLITALLLLLPGCETFDFTKPEGFARYKRKGQQIKAISADGVVIKVYMADNKPYGNSEMWMESVNLYMKNRGYKEINKQEVKTGEGLKGLYTEYIYRYYGRNYIYSLTLFADREKLYLVESGGEEDYYKKRRESILSSIATLKKGK